MEEEKPLEWRKIVEILKRKGNELLAAQAAQAAQLPHAASPPSQEAAHTSTEPHSAANPSTASLAEPPQPTGGSAAPPSKKKKKKKKKQAADSEEKHEEPESSEPGKPAGGPVTPPFVFTAGANGADEGWVQMPLGGRAVIGTAPPTTNEDKSGGVENDALPGNARVDPGTAAEGEEATKASLLEAATDRVTPGDVEHSEEAPAEPKSKVKKKKKKGKGGKGVGTEGSAPEAEAGSSLQPPRSDPAGSAEESPAQDEGAERSHASAEAAGSLNLAEDERGKRSEKGAQEWPPEQPTGWSDTEEVPDFVSDSGGSDGEEGERDKSGAPERREQEEMSGAQGKRGPEDRSDWEERSDLWEGEEGEGETRSGDERKKDGDEEWGELEEDDVEQLLMLGQLREATKTSKVAPARKKRPAPPAPQKPTQTPSKPPDTQQHRPAAPPTPFRPRGSPSERVELHLPAGRLIVNRADFDARPATARFFVIKSNSVDDVHKSIKYGVWASTPYGNKRLHAGFKEACAADSPAQVFLLFSVNASGKFCGVAEMMSDVDFDTSVDVWQEDNLWTGRFKVHWHIIKDVPSREFYHIRVPSNENKPVTNSRDTQDVPYAQGLEMLAIFAASPSVSSILDYFALYDTQQQLLQEDRDKAKLRPPPPVAPLDPWDDRPQPPGPGFRPRGPDFFRPPFPRPPLVPHNIKTRLCQRFSSPGGCNYGDRCLFAHGVHELRPFRPPPPAGRPPFFPDGRPAFFPDGRPAFFPPPPFGPGGPHHRPPFWRPDGNGNGMGPGFEGPRPWLGPPPEFAGHGHGHHYQQQHPASRLLDALENGNEGLRHGAAGPGGDDVSGDEKDAQDEYLLQLLTEGGADKGQSVPEPGQAPGLGDGSEWAGGREHEDEEVCCICFERPMDAALEPCRHELCRQCAELMRSERNSCPVCNAEIESILPRT
ncbi:YTH domain containig protein [Klebsormidium nitens]|uniref:YTH domain containig protein n=1 Tax=Klebsormidium nitens TaxID=105231 RepID=A0A1Y1HU35_KLENI|nr:YTH domain containig protein [Klebsormidium nitens]|eukprot:GAQ82144.1 YTH domain containig protein [Klebsormidium nitens]